MMKLLFFCALAVISLQMAAGKASIRRAEIDMGDVDEFDVTTTSSPIHNNDEWKNLSPEERRKLAIEFYYSIIGLCEKRSIQNCDPGDAQFIAKAFAKGDPECFFYCGYDKMKQNAERLPGKYTLALAIDIGLDWVDEVKDISDMEALDNSGRRKTGAIKKKSSKRVVFIMPVVFAALSAIINIGSMAAIGYFSNDRNIDDMSRLGAKGGQIKAALTPALKVTRVASRACFDIKGVVNVKDGQGNRFSKKIGDLKVGDNVESANDNGEIVYSNVYYIAHGDGKKMAKLLRVYYEEDGKVKSIGLNERHLIYSTKADSELETAKAKPTMASKLNKGDFLWVHKDNKLVAKKITEILPYLGKVIHPLTDNHHIIVDGVHASVHIINESAYRMMTAPLKWVCWMSPEAGKSKFVNKMVRFVENAKESFANEAITSVFDGREVHMGIYGMSE